MSIPITGHTQLTGLLGSPVAHSISPRMHNESFQYWDLDYVYLCFDVDEQTLPEAVDGLRAIGIRGLNLTMPCKNRMVDLCDSLSPAARLMDAVNTVVNDNGHLTGHNTDGTGFVRALQDAGHGIAQKTMTLLGAGGASTAICVQSAIDGARAIHVFARSTSRFWSRMQALADEISHSYPCQVTLTDQADQAQLARALEESQLLVNGTSVGMAPNTGDSLITDSRYLHPDLVVFDAIYEPRQTRLLKLAADAGCQTCNGLYMLLYQGAAAFSLWTGKEMPIAHIKSRCFDHLPVPPGSSGSPLYGSPR